MRNSSSLKSETESSSREHGFILAPEFWIPTGIKFSIG